MLSITTTTTTSMNEERNVLDDLLDNGDDEDFDAELKAVKNDRRSRTSNLESKKSNTSNTKISSVHHQVKKENSKTHNSNNKSSSTGNGNSRSRRSISRESSCASQYSCESGSCSCENHSSIANDRSPEASRSSPNSNHSYQSFTRSPSLKIKITKNSDSRTVAKSSISRDDDLTINRKRKHDNFVKSDRDGLKRRRRNATSPISLKKKEMSKKRDYSSLIKYFFKDSCYFVMKSNNEENVEISKREGVWSTPMPNEIKLNSAFKEFRNVILIFSVKESGKFQGFARLSSEAQYDLEPVRWVLPPGVHSCPFGGIFFIDWICRNELSFTKTSYLYNAFNEAKPVKIARDGQEIEPKVGEELCRLFPPDEFVDLIPMLKRMKKQTLDRPRKRHSRGPFMHYEHADSGGRNSGDYRVKPSLAPHLLSSLSQNLSIKKRLDHPENYYSNRMKDDRYNRMSRRIDSYGINGYSGGSYRYPGSYSQLPDNVRKYSSSYSNSQHYRHNASSDTRHRDRYRENRY